MRVLHLNTHVSGGSYEYAMLLSTALGEQRIVRHVLCKNSPPAERDRPLLDHIIRRLYVSLSIELWHGTQRRLSPPAAEDLEGVDVVHLHVVADWFDVPRWLETLPRRIGIVTSVHGTWDVTGGNSEILRAGVEALVSLGIEPEILCEPVEPAWSMRHKWEAKGYAVHKRASNFISAEIAEQLLLGVVLAAVRGEWRPA
jgi:hypothetical protein